MKKNLTTLLLIAIILAAGHFAIRLVQDGAVEETETRQAAHSEELLSVNFPESIDLKVGDWIFGRYPKGEVMGGKTPYTLSVTGLPTGVSAEINGEEIMFKGVPRESGKFDVSISVVDAHGKAVLAKTNLKIEPVKLTHEQLLKERAAWLNNKKEPTYEPIKTYDGFSTIINWVLQQ